MTPNVLITCAGRRGYLVDYFRAAVAPYGGRVVTANSAYFAAGLLAGDRRRVVPRIDDPDYIPALLRIVEEEEIALVLSLFDVDLAALAEARPRFEALGARVAVGDPETVAIANDKRRTYEFCRAHGIPTPRTWRTPAEAEAAVAQGAARFPLLVKPRWGMGSLGVRKVRDAGELAAAWRAAGHEIAAGYVAMMAPDALAEAVLVQEFVAGEELGADVLADFEGNRLATAVKRKISSRADGADFAVTVADPEAEALCARIAGLLRHRGNLDIDLIRPEGGSSMLIELNARFGGGYPFSHLAGARFPEALAALVRGETPDPGRIEPGVHAMMDLAPRRFEPVPAEMETFRPRPEGGEG